MPIIPGTVRPSLATWASGKFYGPAPYVGNSTRAMVNATTWYVPILVPHKVTFDRWGVDVTVQGTTAVLRAAIFRDNKGVPGTLVGDLGNLSVTGTGALLATVSQACDSGLYWLAISQISSAGACTLRAIAGQGNSEFVYANSADSFVQGNAASLKTANGSGDSGAFGASAILTGISPSAQPPYVALRVA